MSLLSGLCMFSTVFMLLRFVRAGLFVRSVGGLYIPKLLSLGRTLFVINEFCFIFSFPPIFFVFVISVNSSICLCLVGVLSSLVNFCLICSMFWDSSFNSFFISAVLFSLCAVTKALCPIVFNSLYIFPVTIWSFKGICCKALDNMSGESYCKTFLFRWTRFFKMLAAWRESKPIFFKTRETVLSFPCER